MKEAKRKAGAIPASVVKDFMERHRLRPEDMDSLFGFTSKGRSCRRWMLDGAPAYVGLLMKYVDAFGIELLQSQAAQRTPIAA